MKYSIEIKVYDEDKNCKACGWTSTRFVIANKVEVCPDCFIGFLEKGDKVVVV